MLTWNTGFKYINPTTCQPLLSFQILAKEQNIYYKKHGDPGGFCYTWCMWYIETKFLNKNIDSKTLITKVIKKINSLEIKLVDYIRNYSNQLINEKYNFLKKINFDYNDMYNEDFNQMQWSYIMNHIIKYFNS